MVRPALDSLSFLFDCPFLHVLLLLTQPAAASLVWTLKFVPMDQPSQYIFRCKLAVLLEDLQDRDARARVLQSKARSQEKLTFAFLGICAVRIFWSTLSLLHLLQISALGGQESFCPLQSFLVCLQFRCSLSVSLPQILIQQ